MVQIYDEYVSIKDAVGELSNDIEICKKYLKKRKEHAVGNFNEAL
jgi:hypothetical protein